MKIYMMPNGIKRQFEDEKAPEGAVLVKKKVETKSVEPENKAVEPENKAPKNKKKGFKK